MITRYSYNLLFDRLPFARTGCNIEKKINRDYKLSLLKYKNNNKKQSSDDTLLKAVKYLDIYSIFFYRVINK